jgi:GTPase Era involved in 16S rRNA processing
MKYPIRIIDTPGFADTRGYFKDKEIIAMIKRIMKEIKNISMILFVMKST